MRVFLEKNRVLGLLEAILSLFGTILYNMPLFGVYFEGLQKFLYPKFSKVLEKNNIFDIEPKLLRKISTTLGTKNRCFKKTFCLTRKAKRQHVWGSEPFLRQKLQELIKSTLLFLGKGYFKNFLLFHGVCENFRSSELIRLVYVFLAKS